MDEYMNIQNYYFNVLVKYLKCLMFLLVQDVAYGAYHNICVFVN